MRAVVQRVRDASVQVGGEVVGQIGHGVLAYVAVAAGDGDDDVSYIADKLLHLRIFGDEQGKLNLSVAQVEGAILLVSAFTVLGDARHGRRPGFEHAAKPDIAEHLLRELMLLLQANGVRVACGRFAADMWVRSTNDGPIALLLDSGRLL